ncbi:MAG: ATP synthase F1 subunit gamma [Oscillospiraceae bacterium]
MASMREIRARIKNVKNTQQLTKAMKMVSVSKLRKVKLSMEAMRPFTEKAQEILSTLLSDDKVASNIFVRAEKDVKKVCYVLFVGNRGLCGAYNSNIERHLENLTANETHAYSVIVCGRWGKELMRSAGLPVTYTYEDMPDTPATEQGIELTERLKGMYIGGEADKIVLVYQRYVNALIQVPCEVQLLPVVRQKEPTEEPPESLYIFEPDQQTILDNIMRLYINSMVYSALLEAKAGEHSARMRAMTAASDNTRDIIADLSIKLNRARQAAITTEISEIVGGAAALKGKSDDESKAAPQEKCL